MFRFILGLGVQYVLYVSIVSLNILFLFLHFVFEFYFLAGILVTEFLRVVCRIETNKDKKNIIAFTPCRTYRFVVKLKYIY